MMTILVQIGLKKVVTGRKPEILNQIEWEKLDEKALSALWKRLETLYAAKPLANRLMLKKRLFTFRMNECELLRNHISQFISLLNDLKNV
ncbi:hypothetical protein Gotri_010564 [Gossypium trilobum]|uniref:Uncharacterized protein n=1 Tax=Gossypium trilobum TaxID=34281 RepID=A0A7J9ERR0_9ROSI|nr:hypothetical protein [Gossypium trilobum]